MSLSVPLVLSHLTITSVPRHKHHPLFKDEVTRCGKKLSKIAIEMYWNPGYFDFRSLPMYIKPWGNHCAFWNNFQQDELPLVHILSFVLKLADLPLMTMGDLDTLVPSSSFKRIKQPDEDVKT